MDYMTFLSENYVAIILVLVIVLMTIIGYFADALTETDTTATPISNLKQLLEMTVTQSKIGSLRSSTRRIILKYTPENQGDAVNRNSDDSFTAYSIPFGVSSEEKHVAFQDGNKQFIGPYEKEFLDIFPA